MHLIYIDTIHRVARVNQLIPSIEATIPQPATATMTMTILENTRINFLLAAILRFFV